MLLVVWLLARAHVFKFGELLHLARGGDPFLSEAMDVYQQLVHHFVDVRSINQKMEDPGQADDGEETPSQRDPGRVDEQSCGCRPRRYHELAIRLEHSEQDGFPGAERAHFNKGYDERDVFRIFRCGLVVFLVVEMFSIS